MLTHLTQLSGVTPGWLTIAIIGVAVLSYFLGCFNGSVIVSRYILKNDIRNHGSGNAGLTNFHRVFGGPLTVVVLLADAVKMVAAVLFAQWIFSLMDPELITFAQYWAGLFCLLGHMFPCMFQFRGGKGVLSGGALALMIDWRVALVVWGGFLLLVVATRYVSLGSCWAGGSFPVVSMLVFRDNLLTVLALIAGLLVLWQHRTNIKRLLNGTESKFGLHKKKQPAETTQEAAAPPAGEAPPAPGPEPEAEAAADDEKAAEAGSEPEAGAAPVSGPEPEGEAGAEAEAEPESEPESEPAPEAVSEPEPEAIAEPAPAAEPEGGAKPAPPPPAARPQVKGKQYPQSKSNKSKSKSKSKSSGKNASRKKK